MFFLVRYCRALEEGSFRGRSGDFFWMLFLGACMMVLIACLMPDMNVMFLGASLTFMMVYVWGRRNPSVAMSFLGLFSFTAGYLPWVLLGFSLLLQHNIQADLIGIAVGHIYYFLEDVYPTVMAEGGMGGPRVLRAPRFITRLFDGQVDDPNYVAPPADDQAGGFAWGEGRQLGGEE
jgi:Derlin-2/3